MLTTITKVFMKQVRMEVKDERRNRHVQSAYADETRQRYTERRKKVSY